MSKIKRLYEGYRPSNYQLHINIDEPNMAFNGKVVISGKKVGKPSERLTFHQKNLKITKAKVTKFSKKGQEDIEITRVNCHKSYDEVRLHADQMLYPGEYSIEIEFSGKFVDGQTVGFYPSTFDYEGKKEYIFTTQFESHHAREAFPCIDEPEAKATFDLSLQTKNDVVVLANTEIKSEKISKTTKTTIFESSPVMSCYLLAFVIGNLHFVEATTKRGIKVRSYASTIQPKEKLNFATQEAVKIIDFYEDYFGVNFPLKKCDQVAIPDFESGAMENWGLITYREVALLTDPSNRSISAEQYVAMVVAHELSHQWFGNLVTMKWWDDLWLNESFASIMEHVALDNLHQDWKQWESYASHDIIACSSKDVYEGVQNVGVTVKHPDEIASLFDPAIVYAKGGRLIKMMIDYIGEDVFRTGLKNYFTKFAYQNTTREDLWQCMSDVSNKNISKLMTPWLEQSGLPLITIKNQSRPDQRLLTQARFLLNKKSDSNKWIVPLLPNQPLNHDVLDKTEQTIQFENKLPLLNQNGSGHFVCYYEDRQDRKDIYNMLGTDQISSQGKINVLNDLSLLTRAGISSITESLDITKSMQNEPRDAVWSLICRQINLAATMGEFDDTVENGIKTFRHNIAQANFQKLGWTDEINENPNTIHLRSTMIGLMLASEDKSALDHALNMYNSIDITSLPAERRSLVLSCVVRNFETPQIIKKLLDVYTTNNDPEIKHAIRAALCSTKSPKTASSLLSEGLKKDGFVRPQDYFYWTAYLLRNKYTREVTWQWLVDNWQYLDELFSGGKSLDNFIQYAAAPMQTTDWLKRFCDFFDPMLEQPALARNIKIAKNEISARIEWHSRDLPKLQKYFSSN